MRACGMALSIRSYGGDERVHAHDHHQIVLPVLGSMEMRIGGTTRSLARRGGVLVVGGTAHGFRAEGENRFVVLDVPGGAVLSDGILARAAAAPFFAVDEPLDHLACYLDGTASAGALDARLAFHAAVLLGEAIGREGFGRAPVSTRRADGIARARALIETRYAESLRAAELAGAARMGLSRFYERFRKATGETPADYLSRIRIDRACELLRESDMPISEIALAVGFSDQSALTRCLRRRRGTTPAAVRRSAQEGRFEARNRIDSEPRATIL